MIRAFIAMIINYRRNCANHRFVTLLRYVYYIWGVRCQKSVLRGIDRFATEKIFDFDFD